METRLLFLLASCSSGCILSYKRRLLFIYLHWEALPLRDWALCFLSPFQSPRRARTRTFAYERGDQRKTEESQAHPRKGRGPKRSRAGSHLQISHILCFSNLSVFVRDELCVRLPTSPLSPGTRLYAMGTQMHVAHPWGVLDSLIQPRGLTLGWPRG